MIGVTHEDHGSASILAATSFIASGGGDYQQRFEWQLDFHEYALLREWLDGAHPTRQRPGPWLESARHVDLGSASGSR
jgi:hypothetical protein